MQANTATALDVPRFPMNIVRAEGLEPSRSFEHRHLKPARMPFRHARASASQTTARGTFKGCPLHIVAGLR
jgi:hypothetical protein